jgi:hypothetical protein
MQVGLLDTQTAHKWLQVSVHLDKLLLRDTVIWDISQPYTTAEQYAALLCEELGLRFNWYYAIHAHVQQLLQDIREVRMQSDAASK